MNRRYSARSIYVECCIGMAKDGSLAHATAPRRPPSPKNIPDTGDQHFGELRSQDPGFRIQGSGFRVQGPPCLGSCFYEHRYKDGSLAQATAPRRPPPPQK